MAQITINIPDAQAPRVIRALCKAGGRPETSAKAAKEVLIESIRQTVFNIERQEAEQEALARVPDPVVADLFDAGSV